MSLFRTPRKLYFKGGCLDLAIDELRSVYGKSRAFIVADKELYLGGSVSAIERKLDELKIQHCCFYALSDKPSLDEVKSGVSAMKLFGADTIIAAGSSCVIEAAKLMRIQYEYPETDIKTIFTSLDGLPQCSITLAAVPLLLDGVSAVAPIANTVSEQDEFSITDYQLLPDITIIDPFFVRYSSAEELNSFKNLMISLAFMICLNKESSEFTDSFSFRCLDIIYNKVPENINENDISPVVIERLCEAMGCLGIAYGNCYDMKDLLSEPDFTKKMGEMASVFGKTGDGDAEIRMMFLKSLTLI